MKIICIISILLVLPFHQVSCSENEGKETEFPEIVEQIKHSIAYVEVHTNVKGKSITGTSFVLQLMGDFVVLATARHILRDSLYEDGKWIVPNVREIYVRFALADTFYKAEILTERQDRDIALLRLIVAGSVQDSLGLAVVSTQKSSLIVEGMEIGCTGYDLAQITKRFDNTYIWLSTHKGVVSSTFKIGPSANQQFLDGFQVDIIINKGTSGSPIYSAKDGLVIGMCRGFKGFKLGDIVINYGLAECVPIWAVDKLFMSYRDSVLNYSKLKR